MNDHTDMLFTPLPLRRLTLPNRFVRSATYEGWGDARGVPRPPLGDLYAALAHGGVGTIITGFAFVSQAGRAMHPGQCGIDTDALIAPWREVVQHARAASADTRLIMQIAHTGRQTRRVVTGLSVVGASTRCCTYFQQAVQPLDDAGIWQVIADFAAAADRARQAGFDGVQVHAAHGYLVHQFLSPWTNIRQDAWGAPTLLLEEIIAAIRARCGEDYPILVKLSAAEDRIPGIQVDDTIATVRRLEALAVDAVEISYGTMEYALNIIRGGVPVKVALKVNPLYNRFPRLLQDFWKASFFPAYRRHLIPFSEDYNLDVAKRIKAATTLPVIPVGGFRKLENMVACVAEHGLDAVALCRPLVCEPALPARIRAGDTHPSHCVNCNLCTIFCDSRQPLRCHHVKD